MVRARVDIEARRVFRLSLTVASSLAFAYGIGLQLPFLAPIFALMLTAAPAPPMGVKGLLGLILVVVLTLGVGLVMIPMLLNYPFAAVLLVAVGIFFSSYLTVNLGKGLVGALLTVGVTLISAAGTLSYQLATNVIEALVVGIGIAVVCHRLVYPLFPEDDFVAATPTPTPTPPSPEQNGWIALRATLVVLPAYLLTLINPAAYLPIIMKSVALGQQASEVGARDAAKELLGSTFLGGCLAIVFWAALGVATNLWMFFLWMLLFGLIVTARFYQVTPSRYPPSFWQNVLVTMLILLGSAVQDTASGSDVYEAFATRMALFIAVTFYALVAVVALERLRTRRIRPQNADAGTMAHGQA